MQVWCIEAEWRVIGFGPCEVWGPQVPTLTCPSCSMNFVGRIGRLIGQFFEVGTTRRIYTARIYCYSSVFV